MSTHPTVMNRRDWFKRSGTAAAALALPTLPFDFTPEPGRMSIPDGVVQLSSNENPYGPGPHARQAMTEAFELGCRYPSATRGKLEVMIAESEGLDADHVMVKSGSREILNATGIMTGMNGGELVAPYPTYLSMLTFAQNVGGYVHFVPVDSDMRMDLNEMDRRITSNVRLVFVCNPNNPTGTTVDPDQLRDFCKSVSKRTIVFVDEAYIELADDPAKTSMVDLVREGANVIVSRTFSKIHGMAGLRVGYGIARPDILQRIWKFSAGSPNVVGMSGAMASFKDKEFLTMSAGKVREGREMIYAALDGVGAKYAKSQSNFVFFETGRHIDTFGKQMLDVGVKVGRPFPPFYDWCRVSTGTTEEVQAFCDVLPKVM